MADLEGDDTATNKMEEEVKEEGTASSGSPDATDPPLEDEEDTDSKVASPLKSLSPVTVTNGELGTFSLTMRERQ